MFANENAMQSLAHAAQDLAESLFGPGACGGQGVIHCCDTARNHDGRLHVLRIGPHAPRSEHDFFALNLTRARADALLTTAENLRSEPELSHALAGIHAVELAALRAELLGKTEKPHCAILTRSGDLPLVHPVWSDGTPKLVFTEPENAGALQHKLDQRAQVVAVRELTPRKAIQWLKQELGAEVVGIEAGPRTVGELYESPALVDELVLSRFASAGLAPEALGGVLPADARLFAGMTCVHESTREEPSGCWVFQRWVRAPRVSP
jgi:riboflavin biosynthesis pyrimidine reductase